MISLDQMSDREKVAFLLEALEDAGETLRRYDPAGSRYIGYVREMRGEQQHQEASHG